MDGVCIIAEAPFNVDPQWVGLLLPAGLVLITIAVFARLRARRRRSAGRPTAREQVERFKQEKGVRDDLEKLMVEIEQLARRVGAQLDAKSVRMEKLIEQADARIEELRRLSDSHPSHARPPAGEGDGGAGGGPAAGGRMGRQAEAGGGESGKAPTGRQAVGVESGGRGADDPLTGRICTLADQGLTPVDIARRLNEHVGKIELILALRKA